MPAKFTDIIETIIDYIGSDDPDSKWVVIGSYSLIMHNITVDAKDLDILTSPSAFKAIHKKFKKYCILEPRQSITATCDTQMAKYEIDGITLELLMDLKSNWSGVWEDRSILLDNRDFVYYQGLAIPVASLAETLKGYVKLNRKGDADKILLIEAKIKELAQ